MNIISPPSEYVRSAHKDQEYLFQFRQCVLSVLDAWGLGRYIIQLSSEISVISDLIYFLCNLVFSRSHLKQTLGEEYCSVAIANYSSAQKVKKVLVSHNYPKAALYLRPGTFSVLIYIGLRTIFPYFLRKFVKKFRLADDIIDILSRSNLALFFREGLYYEISKRVTSIVYLKLQRTNDSFSIFNKLAYLVAIQIGVKIFQLFRNIKTETNEDEEGKEVEDLENEGMCVLCLASYKLPTAAACGHTFCWDCIVKAIQITPQCPICRQPSHPRELLQLRNM